MDARGNIYRVEDAEGKTPEQIKEDEERLRKAFKEDLGGKIGEQLEKLAIEGEREGP